MTSDIAILALCGGFFGFVYWMAHLGGFRWRLWKPDGPGIRCANCGAIARRLGWQNSVQLAETVAATVVATLWATNVNTFGGAGWLIALALALAPRPNAENQPS